MSGGGTSQTHGGKIQTIEKTSKPYKLQQLLSCFTIMVGLCAGVGSLFYIRNLGYYGSNPGLAENQGMLMLGGLAIFAIGVIWFIIIRFLVWWHHG